MGSDSTGLSCRVLPSPSRYDAWKQILTTFMSTSWWFFSEPAVWGGPKIGGGGQDSIVGQERPPPPKAPSPKPPTFKGVDAQLQLLLDGRLDFLLLHALDAQVAEAGGGEGGG